MQLEFAIMCDAAEVNSSGLIYILKGGYDITVVSEFPVIIHQVILVVRILCNPEEVNHQHILISQIIDPHGHILPSKITVPFTTPVYPGHPDRPNKYTLKLEHRSVSFDEPGDYTFRFLVDGLQLGQAGLEVKRKEGKE